MDSSIDVEIQVEMPREGCYVARCDSFPDLVAVGTDGLLARQALIDLIMERLQAELMPNGGQPSPRQRGKHTNDSSSVFRKYCTYVGVVSVSIVCLLALLGYFGTTAPQRELNDSATSSFSDETQVLRSPQNAITESSRNVNFETLSLPELAKRIQKSVLTVSAMDHKRRLLGTGTGFFIDNRGYFVTNFHVIENAEVAEVRTEDGTTANVQGVVASNESFDLVLIKTDASLVRDVLPLAETAGPVPVGSRIVVVGSPLGLQGTLSEGIVSGHRTDLPDLLPGQALLQVSAAISPGSSGSPVVAVDSGKVIGVATMILRGGQQLNFAVPVDSLNKLLPPDRGDVQIVTLSEARHAEWQRIIASPAGQKLSTHLFTDNPLALVTSAAKRAERIEVAKEVVAAFPQSAIARVEAGKLLSGLPDTAAKEIAIQFLSEAVKMKAAYFEAWFELSKAAVNTSGMDLPDEMTMLLPKEKIQTSRMSDLAMSSIQTALELKPDSQMAWKQLAGLHELLEHSAEACHALQRALECEDYGPTRQAANFARLHLHVRLAKLFRQSDKFDDAFATLQEAVRTIEPPLQSEAWYQLAVTWNVMAARSGSLGCIEKAHECGVKAVEAAIGEEFLRDKAARLVRSVEETLEATRERTSPKK